MSEILTEGIKFNKGSKALNGYLKIYYKKMPKLKIKIEKGKNPKAEDLLDSIEKNVSKIKEMKDELASLEYEFETAKDKEEKKDLKKKYKDVYTKNKPLIKEVNSQTMKLNHTGLKYGLGAALVAYLLKFGKDINDAYEGIQDAFEQYTRDSLGKDFGPMLSASIVTESKESSMDKQINKIDKAIAKSEKTLNSSKSKRDPKVKEGAEKVIKGLKEKKEELLKIKDETEEAEEEAMRAKTEEAKKKAELKKVKAEKRYKKFLKAEKPVMMVCKIITTATSLTALISFFVIASKVSGSDNLFSRIGRYITTGGYHDYTNAETESTLRGLGKAIGDGFSYGNRYHSVVTEDTNYFPY